MSMKQPRAASVKQRAFIAYLGYPAPETATAEEASNFIDMAMANESYQPLLSRWNTDKIKLHPDIYHEEAATQKAERFTAIFEFCESERETYQDLDPTYWPLKKLTLKVCKQAVEWLDSGYAGWDTDLYDPEQYGGINEKIIETYFVPAISNVAPEFIKKERSGNPNPIGRKKENSETPSKQKLQPTKKQKRKRGCLWWAFMLFLAWIAFSIFVGVFVVFFK